MEIFNCFNTIERSKCSKIAQLCLWYLCVEGVDEQTQNLMGKGNFHTGGFPQ